MDGGINVETAPLVAEAGADVIVAGSAVFKGGAYAENIAAIRDGGHARPRRRLMVSLQPCRAVVFDLDGTLADTVGDHRHGASIERLADFGLPPHLRKCRARHGRQWSREARWSAVLPRMA